MATVLDFVRGDDSGLSIPAHPDALLRAGPEFLTRAFRSYGSLPQDNAVTRIVRAEPWLAGNSGEKLALSVEYERSDPQLDTELFVKFSRYFPDAFRDRRRYELEPEVRLAALSRLPEFPVTVARPYFADFNHETGTGLLVTQQIDFGAEGVEPIHRKCMDHELEEPVRYYRATVAALARLAAAHMAGRLSPQVKELFPFDLDAAMAEMPIPWDEAQIVEKARRIGEFAANCPGLLPANVASAQFIARLERDAPRFVRHERAVKHFLLANPDFVALTHWNTNIDNAWFWRDGSGEMHCGLLDWGMVRQMNVAYGLWGGLSASDSAMLEQHLDDLLALFAEELAANDGPRLDVDELGLHFDLSVAMLGLALMADTPALILSRLPDAAKAAGPHDPIMLGDQVAHGFLHVFSNFLDTWERRDFGASLDRLLER